MRWAAVVLSLVLFFGFVVLLEGNGWLVHSVHYDRGGVWTAGDLEFDNLVKLGLYQLVIVACAAVHRRWELFGFTEVFWWTCTQDLVFYGWGGFVYPAGDWMWMPNYTVFGSWTTDMQFAWSFGWLFIYASLVALWKFQLKAQVENSAALRRVASRLGRGHT